MLHMLADLLDRRSSMIVALSKRLDCPGLSSGILLWALHTGRIEHVSWNVNSTEVSASQNAWSSHEDRQLQATTHAPC